MRFFSLQTFFLLAIFAIAIGLGKILVEWFEFRKVYRGYMKPSVFDYDLVVIGGGTAGLQAAELAAGLKAKVALIERKNKTGGVSLFSACVPSKALIAGGRRTRSVRQAPDFGISFGLPLVDPGKVLARIEKVIGKRASRRSIEHLASLGVDFINGSAKVSDPFRIHVKDKIITTRNIVIATGSSSLVPEIAGLAEVPYSTAETLWEIKAVPKKLLILGGGPMGCELALAFRRLGCETVLAEKSGRLLPREDVDVSILVLRSFETEGIRVMLNADVKRFAGGGQALFSSGESVNFDRLILAVGRRANSAGFGLEALSIALKASGQIETDSRMRTRFPNVFACGDVTGPILLAHAASHQASRAVLNALLSPFQFFAVDNRLMPSCIYLDPEVARVGFSETGAKARGIDFEVYKFNISELDRAACEGEETGFVKVITPKGGGKILGATIVSPVAGESIAEFVFAMTRGLSLKDVLKSVHCSPTFSEANRHVAEEWRKKHLPPWALERLHRIHAWRRG